MIAAIKLDRYYRSKTKLLQKNNKKMEKLKLLQSYYPQSTTKTTTTPKIFRNQINCLIQVGTAK